MAQIIFIHGVNTRNQPNNDDYEKAVEKRQKLFRKYTFTKEDVVFFDPYWGGHGAEPSLDFLSIPKSNSDAVPLALGGLSGGLSGGMGGFDTGGGMLTPSTTLLRSAHANFGAFLNSLDVVVGVQNNPDDDSVMLSEALAEYAMDLEEAASIGAGVDKPRWLNDMSNDAELIARLESELDPYLEDDSEGIVSLGLGSTLKKIGSKLVNIIDGPIIKKVRNITPTGARFLGDAVVYLQDGKRRKAIQAEIHKVLKKAMTHKTASGEKIIIVAHSMGANILYDMLSDLDYTKQFNPALGVDLFLSVGTQMGLLEEYKFFKSSVDGKLGARPDCIHRWWHVYNHSDVLSFRADGIFNGVEEFSIDTDANMFQAHGAYFHSKQFYKRLRKRLVSEGLTH